MFTDIEGSTLLLRRVGDETYSMVLEEHHRIIRRHLDEHGGREEGTQGDAFFAVFNSTTACVAAAVDIQRELSQHEWPGDLELRVRMGIHTGEASQAASGIVGYEVHRAARIAAVGHGGQILVSATSAELVHEVLAPEVTLRSLGVHRLKDLGRPETLFQVQATGLAADFPALRSLDNPELANNLPTSLSTFVGRSREFEQVTSLLGRSRLVTLTGPGGTGKTRLALQVAAEQLDGAGEGVWLVELAPVVDGSQVATAVLDALRIRSDTSTSREDELLRALECQSVLIILDNCEHLIDAVASLVGLISRHCPRVQLLVTSREPLGIDGEQIYRVPPMASPVGPVTSVAEIEGFDAVDLFVSRARLVDANYSIDDALAPVVTSLCQRLDGVPLAIELAVARLSSMSLVEVHDRLDQRCRLLTSGSRNALPRQQTLGATVAWSYDLLDESERDVLRRLSVFVNGFDLSAAVAVCSGDTVEGFEVVDIIGSLVNKSLINAEQSSGPVRYRMLETIRQFAAEQLVVTDGARGVLGARDRHADHYLRLCEAHPLGLYIGHVEASRMRGLDAERDNLLAAFSHLAEDPTRVEKFFRLAVATEAFVLTRWLLEPCVLLVRSLSRDDLSGTALRGWAIATAMELSDVFARVLDEEVLLTRRYDEMAAEAIAIARGVGDTRLEIECLVLLGEHTAKGDEIDAQQEYLSVAKSLVELLGDGDLMGWVLLNAAVLDRRRDTALSALEKFRDSGNLRGQMNALIQASVNESDEVASLPSAIAMSEEALGLAEEIGSTIGPVIAFMNLGFLCLEIGDVDAAVKWGLGALRFARRLGHHVILEGSIFVMACVARLRGDAVGAATLIGAFEHFEAETLSHGIDDLHWNALDLKLRSDNHRLLLDELGSEEYQRCLIRGQRMPLDEVCALAVGVAQAT